MPAGMQAFVVEQHTSAKIGNNVLTVKQLNYYFCICIIHFPKKPFPMGLCALWENG